jgi:hypothetical protein
MSSRCTIRDPRPRPARKAGNTGGAIGLPCAAVASMSAVLILPIFMSIAAGLTHVFDRIEPLICA